MTKLTVDSIKLARHVFGIRFPNWGYRGDPCLWVSMKEQFLQNGVPMESVKFHNEVVSSFQKLTGTSIESSAKSAGLLNPCTANHHHGIGMSQGMISLEFWREIAIPKVLGRHEELTKYFEMADKNPGLLNPVLLSSPIEASSLVVGSLRADTGRVVSIDLRDFIYAFFCLLFEVSEKEGRLIEDYEIKAFLDYHAIWALIDNDDLSQPRRVDLKNHLMALEGNNTKQHSGYEFHQKELLNVIDKLSFDEAAL